MKFTCEQQTLAKALNTVSKAVTSRTTIPILKGIMLEAKENGKLVLSASDLYISVEKVIEANVSEPGSIVVTAELFSDIIRKLPNGEIIITEKENFSLNIKTYSTDFTIVGFSTDEFPKITEIKEDQQKICFDKKTFYNMVNKTAFAASIDESKGVITGVLIEVEKDFLNMIALDGFRMAISKEKMKCEESKKIIISAKIINEMNKIISESEKESGDMYMFVGSNKAIMIIEDTKAVLRLMEGEFIKYEDILPKEYEISVILERKRFLEGIERASLMAMKGKNNLIVLSVKNDLMTIKSKSEEGDVKEEIIIEKTGEDIEIGFNSKYLIDALKAADGEKIIMNFNSSTSPCLITPAEGTRYEYLVLPVRINN